MRRPEIINILFSMISVFAFALSAYTFFEESKHNQIAIKELRRIHYHKWTRDLREKEINIDPLENFNFTEKQRLLIRDYWNDVCIEELKTLKNYKVKPKHQAWQQWEMDIKSALTSHRVILQEFCYYKLYEDTTNIDKMELVSIVESIYYSQKNSKLDYNKIILERNKQTILDSSSN